MDERSSDQAVGVVRDYFRKVQVAAIEVTGGTIRVGDTLRFRGHTTDMLQKVESMEINHQNVMEAVKGDLVGIMVKDRVREHDMVFLEGNPAEENL